MRTFITTVIILFALYSNAQHYRINSAEKYTVPWNQIEIDQSDRSIESVSKLNSQLESFYSNFPHLFHLVNLNNDDKPDLLFYWPENSNEPIFELFINQGTRLKNVLDKRGSIIDVQLKKIKGQFNVSLNEVAYSEPPFLNRHHIIEINPFKSDSAIVSKTVLFFGGTEIPNEFPLRQNFEVTQPKYRLRLTPEISNENVICELTTGDKGMALAQKTDSTGRVWYYAMIDNNIPKNTNEFYYIDSNSPEGLAQKMYGWISSRYLKIKE
ncbi:hypothetical protein [Fulvivirga lutea]|uniref:Uncharacterized protein n=1 Tax=Fulvivirga lutea TaxID=2810512 RepID=A0A974WLY5_9BACT|nr:hypothetical protein [Fulvivirga lutea]QSE98675.1 hypothetical protein JR347_06235 [Fulvivirga lutea]